MRRLFFLLAMAAQGGTVGGPAINSAALFAPASVSYYEPDTASVRVYPVASRTAFVFVHDDEIGNHYR